MKSCSYCKVERSDEDFVNARGRICRTCSSCREYQLKRWHNYSPEVKAHIDQEKRKYAKGYYNNNKEACLEAIKKHHMKNRETINEWRSSGCECECGCIVRNDYVFAHRKTNKHKKLLMKNQ